MSPEFTAQIHEAFSRLARRLRKRDLPHGLTNERLSTLATIQAHEPISVSALAEAEDVSLPTMSRMVAKLEVDGLVNRREDKADRRRMIVSTTAKGRSAYKQATQQSLTQLQETLGSLKSEQLAAIQTMLSSVTGPRPSAVTDEMEYQYAIAPVGLCYFDTELRFLYINEWLARIDGLPVEAHLGKPVGEILEDIAAIIEPPLRQVLQTGEPIINGTVEAETPGHPGESRLYLQNFVADKSEDGTVVGVSCVIQDITDRTVLETWAPPRSTK